MLKNDFVLSKFYHFLSTLYRALWRRNTSGTWFLTSRNVATEWEDRTLRWGRAKQFIPASNVVHIRNRYHSWGKNWKRLHRTGVIDGRGGLWTLQSALVNFLAHWEEKEMKPMGHLLSMLPTPSYTRTGKEKTCRGSSAFKCLILKLALEDLRGSLWHTQPLGLPASAY